MTLAFQFDEASLPIEGIRSFLASLGDSDFLWGIIFVSWQPWFGLFEWNKKLMLEVVPGFLYRHLFAQKVADSGVNCFSYESVLDIPRFRDHCETFLSGHFPVIRSRSDRRWFVLLTMLLFKILWFTC
jgi:hypothetical protein